MTSHSTTPLRSRTPAIDIYIRLAQYPILSDRIRGRMREELFTRAIISRGEFNQQVNAMAIESQRREGLLQPFSPEEVNTWQKRKERIRDFHTDAYFADNLGSIFLERIVEEILIEQPWPTQSVEMTFNPVIAPWELLMRQGELYEQFPNAERKEVQHHLEEIKVVLIKRMISNHLPFIGISKKAFSIADLRRIYRRWIGTGRIGGKAGVMLLVWKILNQTSHETGQDNRESVSIPSSYFIGSDVFHDFRLINNLQRFNQKYRSLEEIRTQYVSVIDAYLQGTFPEDIEERLREVLISFGKRPLIVRSSSLLEDNFEYSFSGKYSSYICPNQGTTEGNLKELLDAIRRVYASTLNPNAILHQRHLGLIDEDEGMAVLIQALNGQQFGHFFIPTLSGVGFSQNPFRWNREIRGDDGFLRLVWGIGTRGVGPIDPVANDYPRLIALSHPQLRPESTTNAIRQYSQHQVDVIDLDKNSFKTLMIHEVLSSDYPELRFIASLDKGDYLEEITDFVTIKSTDRFVLTFNNLSKDQNFVKLMRRTLQQLETAYNMPVEIEFTVEILPKHPDPDYNLHILQCRSYLRQNAETTLTIPDDITNKEIIFESFGRVDNGKVNNIEFVIFADPIKYNQISDNRTRKELVKTIGRLNEYLVDESFILMGPSGWGSDVESLGIPVSFADICNTKALVEIGTELSYGTFLFQDLVRTGIYMLPLLTTNSSTNWSFFQNTPNYLATLMPKNSEMWEYLRVVNMENYGDRYLHILMDKESEKITGYIGARIAD